MKYYFVILLLILTPHLGFSQGNILENPVIQQQVESCLYNTYNFNFNDARSIHREIEIALPKHPVTDFLYALIIYWENMPLLPEDKQAAADSLYIALIVISQLKTMLYPFIPFSSQKVHEYLGFENTIYALSDDREAVEDFLVFLLFT